MSSISGEEKVWLTKDVANYSIYKALNTEVEIIDQQSPCLKMKSIKNETELENIVKAHIKDGVAVTKFMYWLKTNIGKNEITEISAKDYLEGCRTKQDNYKGPSFDTISA